MCGIAGIFGSGWEPSELDRMVAAQRHRGPDADGLWIAPDGLVGLGHNRLSIIDLSASGRQPMWSYDGATAIVFNGEIYNYLELRAELSDYPYRSSSDTEVILAAYERWGDACVDRFLGMFSFLLWDSRRRRLLAVRDRLGVKPLYYTVRPDGTLLLASEIKALFAAGIPAVPNAAVWTAYLTHGATDGQQDTFWCGVRQVEAGHQLIWENGAFRVSCWYDLAARVGDEIDTRSVDVVCEEYLALLKESIQLRFRSDVPVGVNLSGGLDSSTLLGLIHAVQGKDSTVRAYTFATGDPAYDETPWVEQMLQRTRHPSRICRLNPADVPALAESVQRHEDEPFGGVPTMAYAALFAQARAEGTIVLLDGQGMDEQWAGYDYYARALAGGAAPVVQGSNDSPVRPQCLRPEVRAAAAPPPHANRSSDRVRNLQLRDIKQTKIPRALRFNDRASMRSSTELREPFLDHRLFEIALRQPVERKIVNGTSKWMLRRIAAKLLPEGVVEAPKRPLQTPQREWLRGPLCAWASEKIEKGLAGPGGQWLQPELVRAEWNAYLSGATDNSFFVWQWVSLGMMC